MKILFEQSGGIAGLSISSSVDTHSLPASEKELIQKTISDANFFALPPTPSSPPKGSADYYRYVITVEGEGAPRHTVEMTDLSSVPELRPLIKFMRERALQK